MVALRDGEVVVAVPAGESLRFGVDQIAEAEEFVAAVMLGIETLRQARQRRGGHRGAQSRKWRR